MARILIVDDDQDLLKLARTLLASQNHDVHTATNAQAAMDSLNEINLDLLITDVNMPDHSGFELIRSLRNRQSKNQTNANTQNQNNKAKSNSFLKNSQVAVAMLTARREKTDIDLALSLGVSDYILKPLDPPLFLQKIDDLIAKFQPAIQPTELRLSQMNLSTQAMLSVPIEVVALSEAGLSLEVPMKLREESYLQLQLKLFSDIGIETPRLKVLSCLPKQNSAPTSTKSEAGFLSHDRFVVRMAFIGIDEKSLQKIRAWTYQTMAKANRRIA